ncbi:NAD(P)/FAD-dependent oxidoreductase [Rhodococcus sp. BP-252]|uniref:phytoene desaturase family protein n=1 Tax=unclassified Rhodococcus (in: high G+C Gram-positive bacteria) TaxID=192944 RepID=UPI001C9A65EA|nr:MULTISPECIES: NAD(P)/FAD-dependent oxidoreductase [unclassified Rhodococcus (in: high G+C Gram-positive bacteria)]MBY6411364.1 NAD(P)/FAD-dependent oxidoreductase [Rhodococcus sp. BP-320]MBY6416023.1 NAD(P)/FAD-dependent oxidoreductase [Rhodococcus sp. BP-321]MBY6420468.1 NAD(P)/FAD-dependent oxidoreductase [Rhodococcus sp. BP-324]MBY6426230.1 NAD(P)/FAD-dependent oxidoreductase [Rhodococcus sp. BP-323]MBY6431229.1 NAD(P)/FAD-dependent oxidoreductase [Rhodococcus sp. BP-322]
MIDVVVVGSGHNALTAACYLSEAGMAVEVLERDVIAGGGVSSAERFPGHRVDRGSSAHIMVRHTGVIEELGLAEHGLRYVDCDPWAFAPGAPGTDEPALVFHRDLDRTCESIARACGSSDAAAYRRFVGVWGPRSARTMRAFSAPPTGPNLLRSFWGLGAPDGGSALSREFLTTGDALLDETFDSERLKAALAWFGAQSGPPMSEPGTAPMVGFAALMHTLPPGRAIGGSGALTEALISKLTSAGGSIALGDAVVSVSRRHNEWVTTTASGRTLRSRMVVAGCHVLATLDLLAAGGYDRGRIDGWRRAVRVGPGIGMAVRLATDALPRYASAEDPSHATSGLQLLVRDRAHLRLAHGAASAGKLPPTPVVLGMSFTALDPSVAPPGQHQVSLWSQWHPHTLSGNRAWRGDEGRVDARDVAEREGDRIVAEISSYAPGFDESVLARHVQSPADIERELGMIGGNIMHVEMSLDQMMMWRPIPQLSSHRVPDAPGLYLTGASTHPGGGVSAASGRSAARIAVKDAREGRLRRWIGDKVR